MSETLIIIIGILLFALATIILYMIGLKKKMGEDEELAKKLLHNASLKVLDHLKHHDSVNSQELSEMIKGVQAKNLYSSKTAVVVDEKEFKYQLIDFMIQNNYLIEEKDNKGKKIYRRGERRR